MGYRWYDKQKVEPRFCFGHGLSYTNFKIDHLQFTPAAPGQISASVDVTNTGDRAGAEVVQVYIRPPDGDVDRPVQELKAFERVNLEPGETKTVQIKLDGRAFAFWDRACTGGNHHRAITKWRWGDRAGISAALPRFNGSNLGRGYLNAAISEKPALLVVGLTPVISARIQSTFFAGNETVVAVFPSLANSPKETLLPSSKINWPEVT